jgi:hypothetical protein
VQWQPNGAAVWNGLARIDASSACCFIHGVSDGQLYNVQARAVNCAGVPSPWVIAGPCLVSDTLSVLTYSGIPVAPAGTLLAQALSDGTAQIVVLPFTAIVGGAAVGCTPNPTYATLTGLSQAQNYFVYYIDPSFAGGSIVPIATQAPADFLNKSGYFFIGEIVTPSYVPRYYPSAFVDGGTQTTLFGAAAYDNNISTAAQLSSSWWTVAAPGLPVVWGVLSTEGIGVWYGFPIKTLSASSTLSIVLAVTGGAQASSLTVTIGGTATTLGSFSAAAAEAVYTMTIPAGTDLSTISVQAISAINAGTPGPGLGDNAGINVYEIWIQ